MSPPREHGSDLGADPPAAGPAPAHRWVGGKRWFVEKGHVALLPTAEEIAARGGVYREPFAGGAAIALARYAGRCPVALSDTNAFLIRTYHTIRDMPEPLIAALEVKSTLYGRETFEAARATINSYPPMGGPAIEEAVAFLVILGWGYNGLWRVTKHGKLNTPFGKPSKPGTIPKLFDAANLRAISRVLNRDPRADIRVLDYETALDLARPGDLLFLDPIYEPLSATSNFTGYGAAGFASAKVGPVEQGSLFTAEDVEATLSDSYTLAGWCEVLHQRGVHWAMTNSASPEVRRLWARWNITEFSASRSVSSKTTARGPVTELLVRNF